MKMLYLPSNALTHLNPVIFNKLSARKKNNKAHFEFVIEIIVTALVARLRSNTGPEYSRASSKIRSRFLGNTIHVTRRN